MKVWVAVVTDQEATTAVYVAGSKALLDKEICQGEIFDESLSIIVGDVADDIKLRVREGKYRAALDMFFAAALDRNSGVFLDVYEQRTVIE